MIRQLERDLPELLSFFSLPQHLWRKLRTTNIIERCFVKAFYTSSLTLPYHRPNTPCSVKESRIPILSGFAFSRPTMDSERLALPTQQIPECLAAIYFLCVPSVLCGKFFTFHAAQTSR
jgi:hypothetical protein